MVVVVSRAGSRRRWAGSGWHAKSRRGLVVSTLFLNIERCNEIKADDGSRTTHQMIQRKQARFGRAVDPSVVANVIVVDQSIANDVPARFSIVAHTIYPSQSFFRLPRAWPFHKLEANTQTGVLL